MSVTTRPIVVFETIIMSINRLAKQQRIGILVNTEQVAENRTRVAIWPNAAAAAAATANELAPRHVPEIT